MYDRRSLLRVPVVALLLVCLTGGCSLLGGSDEPSGGGTTQRALPNVAWKQASAAQVRDGGTLRLGIDVLPANLNPDHASNSDSDLSRLMSPTRGSAVRITADGGWEVDHAYAKSVKVVSRSPLAVEVVLNPKAVWQDGSPIRAGDMEAYTKARDGSNGTYEVSSTRGYDDIESVTPGDDDTSYTVTFERPIADWPQFVYPALPAKAASKAKTFNQGFTDRAVPSNGPFVVSEIDRDQGRLVMKRNPRWWGTTPKLESIVWQAAKPQVQLKAVAAGELDVVRVPATLLSPTPEVGDQASLQVAAGTEWTQLTMNGASGPLREVEVRRAVAAALDRTTFARQAARGTDAGPVVMGSFIHVPGQAGYVDESDRLKHGRAVAAELLDEAGWTLADDAKVRTRKGKPLALVMPVPATTRTSQARAATVVKQLGAVGIRVDLQSVPDDEYFTERIIPLDFDLASFSYVGTPFPIVETEALFHPIDSGQNVTGLDDSKLGDLWDKANRALSESDRAKRVRALDERLFRDVPIVPLGVAPTVAAVRAGVVNIGAAQFRDPDWTVVGFRLKAGT